LHTHRNSVLNEGGVSKHHTPALPKHFLDPSDFTLLSHDVLPNLSLTQIHTINHLFCFREEKWIAVGFEGDCIFALRVLESSIFQDARRDFDKWNKRMPTIRFQDHDYKVLLDDGILFAPL